MVVALNTYGVISGLNHALELLGDRNALTLGNNTILHKGQDGESAYTTLHGNKIVQWESGAPNDPLFSMCGYPTVTTRDRLNRYVDGLHVYQEDYAQFANGVQISSSRVYRVSELGDDDGALRGIDRSW